MNSDHVFDDSYVNQTEDIGDEIVIRKSPSTMSNNEYISPSDSDHSEYRDKGSAGDDIIVPESFLKFLILIIFRSPNPIMTS